MYVGVYVDGWFVDVGVDMYMNVYVDTDVYVDANVYVGVDVNDNDVVRGYVCCGGCGYGCACGC